MDANYYDIRLKMRNGLLLFIMMLSLLSFAQDSQKMVFSYNETDLRRYLDTLSMPIVDITTVDGEEPTCDYVYAPEGLLGKSICNATKVPGKLIITIKGDTIFDSGEYEKKQSGLTIKIRGNTSAWKDKKSFKLKLQRKEDLLCRDEEEFKDKDWVLLSSGSSLNTKVGFWLSELIDQEWTPAHQYVNLFINNSYRGIYILAEQISVNSDCRIDLDEEMGYMLEYDAYFWNEPLSFPSQLGASTMQFTYKYPDYEDISIDRDMEIREDIIRIEKSIINQTYETEIDCLSFAKWLLAWDILGNNDPAGSNIYILKKNQDSRIICGPLWDFDAAFKNPDKWVGVHEDSYFWFMWLLKSSNNTFSEEYINLWNNEGSNVINKLRERISDFIKSDEGEAYDQSLAVEYEMGLVEGGKNEEDVQINLNDIEVFIINWLDNRRYWLENKIKELQSSVSTNVESEIIIDSYDLNGYLVGDKTTKLFIKNGKKMINTNSFIRKN